MRAYIRLSYFLLIWLSLVSCSGQLSQEIPPITTTDSVNFEMQNLTEKIDNTVARIMEDENIPGAAIVIVKDGKTIFKRGYGLANLDSNTAVNPDKTLFRIGSVSKALTAQALIRMVDNGNISFDDDVSKYVPEIMDIRNESGFAAPIKIRHLVTHTAGFDQIGIGRHIWDLEKNLDERKALRPDLQTFLFNKNLRRTSPPGVHYRYDTYGITLAGLILEKVTGQPFDQAMKTILFEPLGMKRTFVEASPELFSDLATGYGYLEHGYAVAPYEVYVTTPASSIDATPADMGRLLEDLTRNKNTFPAQFRPHPDFPGVTRGMMEHVFADKDNRHAVRSVGHGGSMLGFKTSLTVIPKLKLGYFIITNRNAEAGGARVSLHGKINDIILDTYHTSVSPVLYKIPAIDPDLDLTAYEGAYYYGVFCQTCSQAEYEAGAWQKGNPINVRAEYGVLVVGGERYYKDSGDGVFVRQDGIRKIFFGNLQNGKASFFSYSTSPDTFERQ